MGIPLLWLPELTVFYESITTWFGAFLDIQVYPSSTSIISLMGFVYQNKCWKRGSSYGTLWASKLGSVGGLYIKLFSCLHIGHGFLTWLLMDSTSQLSIAEKECLKCDSQRHKRMKSPYFDGIQSRIFQTKKQPILVYAGRQWYYKRNFPLQQFTCVEQYMQTRNSNKRKTCPSSRCLGGWTPLLDLSCYLREDPFSSSFHLFFPGCVSHSSCLIASARTNCTSKPIDVSPPICYNLCVFFHSLLVFLSCDVPVTSLTLPLTILLSLTVILVSGKFLCCI